MTLGASPSLFVKITSGQIFISSLIGKEGYGVVSNWDFIFYLLVFLLGAGIILWAFINGTSRFRLFLIFVGMVYLAGLFSPMASTTKPQWSIMLLPGNATRYWFLPMLGFGLSCLYLLNKKNWIAVRIFGCVLFLMMAYGVKSELVYNPWPDLSFKKYAERFESLPVGGKLEIPIMPESWSDIKLIKK
jgi:hypothetical protein